MKRASLTLAAVCLLLPAIAHAQFDWGDSCSSGDGTFNQYIPKSQLVTIGEIPADRAGVTIALSSPADVDVQLIDKATGHEIIAWPYGDLNGPSKACTTYKGVEYCYSGYNGGQTTSTLGHEWIEVHGVTNRTLIMRAFGYAAGNANVTYSYQAADNTCNETGSGSFQQQIAWQDTVVVGDVPGDKTNVRIEMKSSLGQDIDVQVWDGDTPVVAWPNGLLSGPSQQELDYKGVHITYSGYNGIGGNWGHESIEITGHLGRTYTIKVFGYQSGYATVDYEWGVGVGQTCLGIAALQCMDGLACKEVQKDVVDAAGKCHTETWCASPETAHEDCSNLIHIMVPGAWTCTQKFTCKFVTVQPAQCHEGDPTYHYVGDSPEQCAVIKFTCGESQDYFSDPCGCGCRDVDATCTGDEPLLTYSSTDAQQCTLMLGLCPTPSTWFVNGCGCGCECPVVIDCEGGACDQDLIKATCPNTTIAL